MFDRSVRIPLLVKVTYTGFLCILVPIYWRDYGPSVFLWFSDIALFTVLLALWLESCLLGSMAAVGALVFTLGWNLDILTGGSALGLVDYMFDPALPLYLRGFSLYHVVLLVMLLWLPYRLGYDPRAVTAQCVLMCLVLLLSYLVAEPSENINWVFGPEEPQTLVHPLVYLGLLMIALPVLVCLPTHYVLMLLFGKRAGTETLAELRQLLGARER
ncbi:MAG: hypothetical protein ACE5KF_06715 [Kiloniellaceae bacterium]